jgi:hypothetical protein
MRGRSRTLAISAPSSGAATHHGVAALTKATAATLDDVVGQARAGAKADGSSLTMRR